MRSANGKSAGGDMAILANMSVTSMASDAGHIEEREHRAAQTRSGALLVHRCAHVRWPEPWPHLHVSEHVCRRLHGGATAIDVHGSEETT
jgi:hypothetical protein